MNFSLYRSSLSLTFLLFAAITAAPNCEARWATKEDAAFVRLKDKIEIQVNTDATFTLHHEFEDEILQEPARQEAGIFHMAYNSQASKVKILHAASVTDGRIWPVETDFIQDKPLASSHQGFDQINQIMIAFPKVDIGSKIQLEYEMTMTQVPFQGFFSQSIAFGQQRFEKNKSMQIRSKLPLFIGAHDPEKYLEIREWREGADYLFSVRLKRPIYRRIIDEQKISIGSEVYPWVDIASTRDWSEMPRALLPLYEKVLQEKLPATFQKIMKKAMRETDDVARFNRITSLLAESMHYLGDWRPVNGTHVPRPLKVIAETKFGDCKDFSSVVTAILRQMGYEANVAVIKRGVDPDFSPTEIPSIYEFNHAIVWVKTKTKEYWIDPTNQNSYAQGIMDDIEDRKTLVLDPKKPFLSRTPAGLPGNSVFDIDMELAIQSNQKYQVTGSVLYGGRAAIPFVGAALNQSKQTLDYNLIANVADMNRVTNWKTEKYDLRSRVVKDFHFQFSYLQEDSDFRTTAGSAIPISSNWLAQALLIQTNDRVSDLFLGDLTSFKRHVRLKNIHVVGDQNLGCAISTKWADIKREYLKVSDGATIIDSVQIKESRISAQDLRSKDYRALQKELRNCFDGTAVVYQLNR